MKANELRIGNFIYFNNNIEPKRLIKITARFFTALAAGRPHYELVPDEELNGYHQPIQLTPSMLEAAGFKMDGLYNSAQRWMGIFNQPLIYSNGYCTIPYYPLTEIKYLHQLQNIYFALTGSELEIDVSKIK